MPWRIDRQANGLFAVWSSRVDDYIVIDADAAEIERVYAEKGAMVYVASARMQMERETPAGVEGEAKIEASRRRGAPPEEPPDTPIGSTGLTIGDFKAE